MLRAGFTDIFVERRILECCGWYWAGWGRVAGEWALVVCADLWTTLGVLAATNVAGASSRYCR